MDAGDEAEVRGAEEVKDAMMNVDDAMAELKTAFAAMTDEALQKIAQMQRTKWKSSKMSHEAEAVEETEEAKDESRGRL